MGFSEHELWVERRDPRDEGRNCRLFGLLRIPDEGDGPFPAVICAHGFTANHSEADPYAIALAERGFVTLAIDFFGGGMGIRSDGTLLDMTVETEAEDLSLFLDALRQREDVDEGRIGLLGCSQGGFVSTMVASRRPGDVFRLALMYPAFVLHDDALRLYPDEADIPDTYLAFEGYEPSRISRAYNLCARATDPYPLMERYQRPCLIAHGDADIVVPLRYSRKAAKTFADARLNIVEAGTHGFSGDALEQAKRLVCDFFCEN